MTAVLPLPARSGSGFHPADPARPEALESQTSWQKFGDLGVLVTYSVEVEGAVVEGISIGDAYIEACAFSRGTVSEWRAEIESELERARQGYVSRKVRPPFSDAERLGYLYRVFSISREAIDSGLRAEVKA